jgi:hypothetical protein
MTAMGHIKGALLYNNGEWSALYDGTGQLVEFRRARGWDLIDYPEQVTGQVADELIARLRGKGLGEELNGILSKR